MACSGVLEMEGERWLTQSASCPGAGVDTLETRKLLGVYLGVGDLPSSCQMHPFPPGTWDTRHCFGQLPGPCLMYVLFPVEAITQGLTLPLTSWVTLGKALTLSGLCSPICEMGTLGRYLPPTFEDSLTSYYSSCLSLSVSVPLCVYGHPCV